MKLLDQPLDQLRKRVWGYDSFRPLQQKSIECILHDRDSLTVLPTGSGKSLCYQLPALAREGVAVVVSPLIALMKDQVDALVSRGVAAATVNSTQAEAEKQQVADQIRSGTLKLLYLAPERLLARRTIEFLKTKSISFFAIDEAHCVSQWGHDFRPEYTRLGELREHFPQTSMHAFTATASPAVRKDIVRQLQLESAEQIIGDFDRPNLVYRMVRGGDKFTQLTEVLNRHQGQSGIIYCTSRREVDRIAAAITVLGWSSRPYHAGLSKTERHENQDAFLEGHCDVLVATVAFGMGVDKADVRFVIHTGMPRTIEHYQQESGRAGRDGLPAECVLLYGPRDYVYWKDIIAKEKNKAANQGLDRIYRLCNSIRCRHKSIAESFGQTYDKTNCSACDVCLNELELLDDPVETAQKILACVLRLKERFGAAHVAAVLAGNHDDRVKRNGHHELSTFAALADFSTMSIRSWITQLIEQGYLCSQGEYPTLALTDSGRRLMQGHGNPKMVHVDSSKKRRDPAAFVPSMNSIAAFAYFRKGDSVASVAGKMQRAESTVARYLADYVRYHRINDPSPWVEPAVARRVLDHRHLASGGKLKPLFDRLGGDVSYEEIRITLACAAS